jgi:hypothetical protein
MPKASQKVAGVERSDTPGTRHPRNIPPRRGVAEDSTEHIVSGTPARVPRIGRLGFPVVSLRSTTGYFLRCLRHQNALGKTRDGQTRGSFAC